MRLTLLVNFEYANQIHSHYIQVNGDITKLNETDKFCKGSGQAVHGNFANAAMPRIGVCTLIATLISWYLVMG